MTRHVFDRIARFVLAFLALAGITSCGGGVSGPPPVNDPTRITILPATATLFSGTPTTFVISGGTGSYIVSSSNQSVIAVSGSIAAGSLTVVPNAVAADTPVTLTVRDTGTTPVATADLTVRPGTVNNELTITPTSTQGGSCAPAICSGSDAVVSARISQGGTPLPGRRVRFEVVSGDFSFITSSIPGLPETLETSITVLTDEAGRVQARIRVTAIAQNQTALLQVTDLTTGSFQRTPFAIAQATGTSPGFFIAPASIKFTGPNVDECANGASADFFVFGGTPPYRVSNASAGFSVSRFDLLFSGDSFTVTALGACVGDPGLPIVVTDATGRTVTALISNVLGTRVVPPLVVAPASVSLSSCGAIASVTAAGGTGNYIATPGSGSLFVTQDVNTFSIQRLDGPGTSTPLNVGISDGRSVINVVVNLTGTALGACPETGFDRSPTSVILSDCSGAAQVTLSGGSGNYTAASDNTSVIATIPVDGNIVSIRRADPSGPFTSAIVTVSDGATSLDIDVTASGTGGGTCPTPPSSPGLTANPPSVTLTDCTTSQTFQVSGGNNSSVGGYAEFRNGSSFNFNEVIGTNGFSTYFVSRAVGAAPPASPSQSLTISDGNLQTIVAINFSGLGAGTCP